jgi:hypothetical protein
MQFLPSSLSKQTMHSFSLIVLFYISSELRRSKLISEPSNFSHVAHMGASEGKDIIKDV